MFDELESVPWKALRLAYGPATDAPQDLAAVRSITVSIAAGRVAVGASVLASLAIPLLGWGMLGGAMVFSLRRLWRADLEETA